MTHDPSIDEALAAIDRGKAVTVRLDPEVVRKVIAESGKRDARLGRLRHVPTLRDAVFGLALEAAGRSKARARLKSEWKSLEAARERWRQAMARVAARRRRLAAAELERLREGGYPKPNDVTTSTKNYYLSVAQAAQMLPDGPVPFELDSLFIRALEHYLAERHSREGLSPVEDGPLADSIGRLLWAAIKDATIAVRR